MLQTNKLTIRFGKETLFEDVSIKFSEGNAYGIIGANGSGKSTFLKVLAKELEPSSGTVFMDSSKRLSFLRQDQNAFDDHTIIETVIMGNKRLYEVGKEKDALYLKPDFNDEDGVKAGELEAEYDHLGGWDSEYDAALLLTGLGVDPEIHYHLMGTVDPKIKVKVLLAQSLFGNPDVLLLDEPTNNLDLQAIRWLEEFLIEFKNTLIIVSHDRYFLNKVCTHIADIDYRDITLYAGNYDFWYESSQLMLKQQKEANKKSEDKIKELQDFIQRFSANASKSRQATSRKKLLDKIEITEIKPSTRRYPYVKFIPKRPLGDDVLTITNLTKELNGKTLFKDFSITLGKHDKIAFVGDEIAKTALFNVLAGKDEDYQGSFKYGETVTLSYFPKEHNHLFTKDISIIDFLGSFSDSQDQTFIRSFLGRMLFSGEDVFKKLTVLSGGERVRTLVAKMMLEESNMMIIDEPTNHLDMESITSLNKGLSEYQGALLFSSTDHQLTETTANKIVEIQADGSIVIHSMGYDEYLESKAK